MYNFLEAHKHRYTYLRYKYDAHTHTHTHMCAPAFYIASPSFINHYLYLQKYMNNI